MLDTYRSGNGFIGQGEYEPIGADNSLIATGLPGACLVSDPRPELGKGSQGESRCQSPIGMQGRAVARHLCWQPPVPIKNAEHLERWPSATPATCSAPAQLSGLASRGEWPAHCRSAPARRWPDRRARPQGRSGPDRGLDYDPDVIAGTLGERPRRALARGSVVTGAAAANGPAPRLS
jgi:hypothetical protein